MDVLWRCRQLQWYNVLCRTRGTTPSLNYPLCVGSVAVGPGSYSGVLLRYVCGFKLICRVGLVFSAVSIFCKETKTEMRPADN